MSLSRIRNHIEVLDRELAMYRVRPIADQITDTGLRLQTIRDLHIYLKDYRKYGGFPGAQEMIEKLFPPGLKVVLSDIPLAAR